MARKSTEFIFIHCAATRPSMDVDAKTIDKWHRDRGFLMIGYNFFIKRDGTIEIGREVDAVGAHTEGYNSRSLGICMAGGVAEDGSTPENNFTHAQWASLERLVREMLVKYPGAIVRGHNEVAPKACPSFNVKEWAAQVELY